MKKHLNGWLAAIAFALLSVALPVQAQLAVGRDYTVIDPAQGTDNPAKIEVIEFFSYACPHCSDLNPYIIKWAAKLPADVAFKRVPVSFNSPFYQLMAKLYYALEAMGELQKLDGAVFNAIHEKGLKLIDDKSVLEWVTGQGVDAKKFSDAYNSFGVMTKVKRADQMAQASKLRGVPALVVDGRYLVVGQEIKSHADLLALTDKVIDKARSERNLKKK
ncbi:thiol:disulfide interchange protein DsbA/DsbL [Propionivibrio sp.]|uniref:thiol:disulfide interchange protein DsbA/DsbL n=1 Tax=Propionivibrio sp. TaxID=2212460 RepID=UPI003BF02C99